MTNQEYLDAAIAARHSLLTGAAAVSVRFADGRAVTYTAANLSALDRYIANLRNTIAGTSVARRSRMVYVVPD